MDPKQIPFLLQLLDDDSEVVRNEVTKALKACGPELAEEVEKLGVGLSPLNRKLLSGIFAGHRRERMRKLWPDWCKPEDECASLEAALGMIADFQTPERGAAAQSLLLDQLAQEFKAIHGSSDDPLILSDFIFRTKKIGGVSQDDYYNPFNSNLAYAIDQKKGLPITLAVILMLVAKRVGMAVYGCALPGHFLAKSEYAGRVFFIDGFHGGKVLSAKAILDRYGASSGVSIIQEILKQPADVKLIVRRILTNLAHAYEKSNDPENSRFMADLLADIEKFSGGIPDYFPD